MRAHMEIIKNKMTRASIQLSMNTIIYLALAIMFLILALVFVVKNFPKSICLFDSCHFS